MSASDCRRQGLRERLGPALYHSNSIIDTSKSRVRQIHTRTLQQVLRCQAFTGTARTASCKHHFKRAPFYGLHSWETHSITASDSEASRLRGKVFESLVIGVETWWDQSLQGNLNTHVKQCADDAGITQGRPSTCT